VNSENSASHAPLVSVLVTTFNHARYVEEALESLRRQTSRDFEVIITDDASSDGCAEIIEAWLTRTGFAAQFIRNPVNRGICANRNAALARASGTFVCSLSGDDAYAPERIERQLKCFLMQPNDVCAVYSDMLVVDIEGRPQRQSYLESKLRNEAPPQGNLFARLLPDNFLPAPCMMVRRSAIATVGGYDESLFFEDFDMWLRLSFRFRVAYLPGLLVRFRMHRESMSNSPANWRSMHGSRSELLAKWLDAGLDDTRRRRVLDALLWNGATQLRINDPEGAGQTFDEVIRNDHRLGRRLMARMGRCSGASAVLGLLLPLYRIYRSATGRSSP
jgi:glycosyltransferase involved in cell wall biosynthesis